REVRLDLPVILHKTSIAVPLIVIIEQSRSICDQVGNSDQKAGKDVSAITNTIKIIVACYAGRAVIRLDPAEVPSSSGCRKERRHTQPRAVEIPTDLPQHIAMGPIERVAEIVAAFLIEVVCAQRRPDI